MIAALLFLLAADAPPPKPPTVNSATQAAWWKAQAQLISAQRQGDQAVAAINAARTKAETECGGPSAPDQSGDLICMPKPTPAKPPAPVR